MPDLFRVEEKRRTMATTSCEVMPGALVHQQHTVGRAYLGWRLSSQGGESVIARGFGDRQRCWDPILVDMGQDARLDLAFPRMRAPAAS